MACCKEWDEEEPCYDTFSAQSCEDRGGTPFPGVMCADDPCPDRWACCYSSIDDCQEVWPETCLRLGGTPQIGVTCTPNPCVVQACCLSSGDCIETRPADCPGTPQGPGLMCSDTPCGPDCPEDITGDGWITIRDLGAIIDLLGPLGPPYEMYPDNPLWNPSADVNGDGVISIRDLGQIIDIVGTAGEPYEVECP